VHLREKEDPWNAIASGFCTGATLAVRSGMFNPKLPVLQPLPYLPDTFNSGPRAAAFSGLFGGVFLAVIEGINLGLQKYMSPNSQMQQVTVIGASTSCNTAP
jgi:hypothetical protein